MFKNFVVWFHQQECWNFILRLGDGTWFSDSAQRRGSQHCLWSFFRAQSIAHTTWYLFVTGNVLVGWFVKATALSKNLQVVKDLADVSSSRRDLAVFHNLCHGLIAISIGWFLIGRVRYRRWDRAYSALLACEPLQNYVYHVPEQTARRVSQPSYPPRQKYSKLQSKCRWNYPYRTRNFQASWRFSWD